MQPDRHSRRLTAVSLFCGCGGFDLGALKAGFEVVAGYDNDEIALETYRRNVSKDAELLDLGSQLVPKFRDVDLLLGGPPCQGFSSAGPKGREDPRNSLWESYVSSIARIQPKAFLLENVYGFSKVMPEFVKALSGLQGANYRIHQRKLNAQFYEVPQHRLRLFVVGIREDVAHEFAWPQPSLEEVWGYRRKAEGLISLEDALADLGPPTACAAPRKRIWGNPHEHIPLENSHVTATKHIPNGG